MDQTAETRDPFDSAARAVCDAFRYLGDLSYAILPQDMAHNLGEFKKSCLKNMRELIDKDIEWIDARVAGGDRMREEWKSQCRQDTGTETTEPVN